MGQPHLTTPGGPFLAPQLGRLSFAACHLAPRPDE